LVWSNRVRSDAKVARKQDHHCSFGGRRLPSARTASPTAFVNGAILPTGRISSTSSEGRHTLVPIVVSTTGRITFAGAQARACAEQHQHDWRRAAVWLAWRCVDAFRLAPLAIY
jgi:hypothetical protein